MTQREVLELAELEARVSRLEARVAVFETAIRLARWGGPLIVAVAALLVQAYR